MKSHRLKYQKDINLEFYFDAFCTHVYVQNQSVNAFSYCLEK